MSEQQIIEIIQSFGDHAYTAFIFYVLINKVTLLLFFGAVAWGVRSVWAYLKARLNNVPM